MLFSLVTPLLCKSSRIIDTTEVQPFQQDLDNNYQWSIRNYMEFHNIKKSKIMRITKTTKPFILTFSLDNSVLVGSYSSAFKLELANYQYFGQGQQYVGMNFKNFK